MGLMGDKVTIKISPNSYYNKYSNPRDLLAMKSKDLQPILLEPYKQPYRMQLKVTRASH